MHRIEIPHAELKCEKGKHMYLYKFVEHQYLTSFFESGSLRIGTIFDFKDIISHSEARADKDEGKHRLMRSISSAIGIDSNSHEPIIEELFRVKEGTSAILKDFSIVVERHSPDGFVFCTSYTYSEELFRRWYEDCEKNDACYLINDPEGFFKEIDKVIKNKTLGGINSNVVYTPDPIPYNSAYARVPPAFTKEVEKYSWQKENRTVWGSMQQFGELRPFVVDVPEARRFCTPLFYIKNGQIHSF